jgi:hypothetical protein
VILVRLVGYLYSQARLLPPAARSPKIPDILLHGRLGLQVVYRGRIVERRKRKIIRGKFPLRQESAENKHRIVAGEIGLFKIEARQISGPGRLEFRTSRLPAWFIHSQIRIIFQRPRNCLGQSQPILSRKRKADESENNCHCPVC